jgi:tRNA threonylcarbamoyladenosine biosynthesis protein TsaB
VLTLALDTTTRGGSVAVTRGHHVLAVIHGDATRTHGERLPAELERALQAAGVTARDLELLAVASGPGAFTGLRIGLAAIQGMSMVLDRPVVAVSALDALAYAARSGTVPEFNPCPPAAGTVPELRDSPSQMGTVPETGDCPSNGGQSLIGTAWIGAWMDAQRGEVFAAYYAPGTQNLPTPVATPILGQAGEVLAALPANSAAVFIGDGAVRYRLQILQQAAAGSSVMDPPAALAPFIAALGIARARQGAAGPPHALQPLYVRRPDAELERLRKAQP